MQTVGTGIGIEPQTLADRRPVWEALSELYLDTDTSLFETWVADVLAASPYTVEELEGILIYEVRPVCLWNAFYWEWVGFDPDWLEREIIRVRRSWVRYFYDALAPVAKRGLHARGQWRRISEAIRRLRANSAQGPPKDGL
jgi:hypothetical protein